MHGNEYVKVGRVACMGIETREVRDSLCCCQNDIIDLESRERVSKDVKQCLSCLCTGNTFSPNNTLDLLPIEFAFLSARRPSAVALPACWGLLFPLVPQTGFSAGPRAS